MGNRTDKGLRDQLIFFTILLLLLALFTSRILLSIGTIIFLVLTCVHERFFRQIKKFFSNPFLLGMAFLFFIPLLSGLWSEDKHEWMRWVRIKLPLFLLPLAFAGEWQLTEKKWRLIAYAFLVLVLTGVCWSLIQYFENYRIIQEGYLRAKVFATPLENDHVRFSLVVCIGVICSFLIIHKSRERYQKTVAALFAVVFIIYLHILSARTGLISLYLFLFFYFFYLIFSLKKIKWTISLIIVFLLMPVAAWFFLPTFQNRMRYVMYDLSYAKQAVYLPGSNDGNRMLSIKAGWDLLKENPWGVGSGDVIGKTHAWYDQHIPQMLDTDKFYPSSEWLLYGGTAGWIGVLLFTIIMCLPFREKIRSERFFWISLNIIAAFSLIFDIGLEAQFGVFSYAFIILWWWKWLRQY